MRKYFVFFLVLSLLLVGFSATALAKTSNEVKILPVDQTIDQDYFSFGDRAEINGTVNGDAYVMGGEVAVTGVINGDLLATGGNLIVSGEVNGDVRIAGGNVTFSEAEIAGNVTVAGGNVTLDSSTTVEGSMVALAANLQIFSPIGKGAMLGGGSVLVADAVGGDLQVGANKLTLGSNAKVDGKLTYYSENKAQIPTDAVVLGGIKHEPPKQTKQMEQAGKNAGFVLAGFVYAIKILDTFWLIIFGLLLIYLAPKFMTKTAENIYKKLGWSMVIGFFVLIALPILGMLLFVSLVGIPIAIILFIFYFLIFWLGRIFAIYAIGHFIVNRLSKKQHRGPAFILGVVIYLILSLIPIVGFFVSLVVSIAGVGALAISKGQVYKELRSKNVI